MKIGLVAPPDLDVSRFGAYACHAERLGFDELWVVEDCFFRGGIAQAAVALARTERITVGVGVLPAAARNAAFAAMELATLAGMFPGRVIAGLGHGMPGWLRQVGAWPASPLTLLREYFTTVRAILGGARVSHDGAAVRLRDVQLQSPPTVVPPLYAGVRGPKSLALAAEVADGTILAEPVTPEYLRAVREIVGPGHDLVAYNVAAVDDSPDHARALARRALTAIGEPDWAPHLAPLPFAGEFAALRQAAGSGEEFAALRQAAGSGEEFAAALPDEWVDQLAVVGTPADARARLAELEAAGAGHLVFIPAGPDPFAAAESLARVRA
ncbi:LLM class flavin-dependent oxidoreductase [Amycolatopsis rhabdoformis]|uniref:LLM class flavin-dependent oxidoreductase n=1 Tax=Amycolatopsis rhabdoformis TaxID=1448059 RepID=A0ABZ1HVR9_9PSEU|nr:LLM class flavin-dependent oxidoreductase [Amycolatopsis rhabdoformis]WSE26355.1 LLM class flavin-dependent oxidoreductase [Amycolatopsis rhabdoformis]